MITSRHASIRKILPVIVLTDAEVILIARLTGRCACMRTSQVIRTVEDDPVVRQMRAGDEAQRDRAAYLSGIVVAEVSIARLARAA